MRIAYLHGLESQSNPDDPKIQFLNQVATAAWAPQIDYRDPLVMTTLLDGITGFKPDLIIGSSIGGWIAYLIGNATGTQTLLYNPAVVQRLFTPPIPKSFNQTRSLAHHTLVLGRQDNIILSRHIIRWFTINCPNWTVHRYPGGHRVPLAVFCQSIQDLIVCKSKFNRKKKHHED